MRTAGDVATPEGLHAQDHLCWVYDDEADFHRRASRFLAEGIEHGLAAVWVGVGSRDQLAAELVGLDVAGLERSGALSILPLPPERPAAAEGGLPDPVAQAAFWEDWARRAAAGGFRGLRSAGDATPWVRTPQEQAVHLAYEAALDRATQRVPLSVMCAFDRSRLGAEAAAAFAAIHPLVSPGASPFQLFFSGEHDLTLRGEVDLTDAPALRRSLEIVAPGPVLGAGHAAGHSRGPDRGELHVDAGGLRFIDHHGLAALDSFGAERGLTVVLHDARSTCAREVVGLFDLHHVRVVDGTVHLRVAAPPGGEGQTPRG